MSSRYVPFHLRQSLYTVWSAIFHWAMTANWRLNLDHHWPDHHWSDHHWPHHWSDHHWPHHWPYNWPDHHWPHHWPDQTTSDHITDQTTADHITDQTTSDHITDQATSLTMSLTRPPLQLFRSLLWHSWLSDRRASSPHSTNARALPLADMTELGATPEDNNRK